MKRKVYTAQCGMTGHIEKRFSFNAAAKACSEMLEFYAKSVGLTGDWVRIEATLEREGHTAVHGARAWRHTTTGQGYRAVINLER